MTENPRKIARELDQEDPDLRRTLSGEEREHLVELANQYPNDNMRELVFKFAQKFGRVVGSDLVIEALRAGGVFGSRIAGANDGQVILTDAERDAAKRLIAEAKKIDEKSRRKVLLAVYTMLGPGQA